MNRRDKQTQILAVAAGTLVVAGLLWFFFVSASSERLSRAEESFLDIDDRIRKAELRIRRGRIVEQEFAALKERIAQAERHMIPVEQLNGNKWMLDLISQFIQSRKHTVQPTRLSNDPLIGKQFVFIPKFDYSGAAYDLELQAYFHDFGRFLADFENEFPYIRIQELEMAPLATPSASTKPTGDLPEELANSVEREQLRVSMRLIVLFRPKEVL